MHARDYAPGGIGPPLPLPLRPAVVDEHADRLCCAADDRATLHEVIRALDAEWVRREVARIVREAKTP